MALLRRCIPQVLRSFRGNRMLSSGVGVRRREAPWLLMAPNLLEHKGWEFAFYSCTDGKVYNYFHGEHYRSLGGGGGLHLNFLWRTEMVGSSHGWIALYDSRKREAWLFEPTTYANIKLPGLESLGMGEGKVRSVTLSEKQGGKAFMIFGAGQRLAFCWPGRAHGWRMFGEEGGYESVVYSCTRRRLLCLTTTMKLEAWDVDDEAPRLASVTPFEFELPELELEQQLKYIAEEEESGELFVVVRRVKIGGTVGFDVYKIEGDELIRMDRGLDGVVMLVGVNDPILLKDGAGLKPNSIYFAYDNRVRPGLADLHHGWDYPTIPGGADLGIYDYATARVSPITQPYQLNVPPIWLTPPRYHIY